MAVTKPLEVHLKGDLLTAIATTNRRLPRAVLTLPHSGDNFNRHIKGFGEPQR
jgi:hypothetical protein